MSYSNQAKKSGGGLGMLVIGGGLLAALLGGAYLLKHKGGSGSSMPAAGSVIPLPGKSGFAKPGGCGCGH